MEYSCPVQSYQIRVRRPIAPPSVDEGAIGQVAKNLEDFGREHPDVLTDSKSLSFLRRLAQNNDLPPTEVVIAAPKAATIDTSLVFPWAVAGVTAVVAGIIAGMGLGMVCIAQSWMLAARTPLLRARDDTAAEASAQALIELPHGARGEASGEASSYQAM